MTRVYEMENESYKENMNLVDETQLKLKVITGGIVQLYSEARRDILGVLRVEKIFMI